MYPGRAAHRRAHVDPFKVVTCFIEKNCCRKTDPENEKATEPSLVAYLKAKQEHYRGSEGEQEGERSEKARRGKWIVRKRIAKTEYRAMQFVEIVQLPEYRIRRIKCAAAQQEHLC